MTTTLTHPTLAALLAAIRAEPDEDTTRLALAHFLEESGNDPAWAELIRVQVELARHDPDECPRCVEAQKRNTGTGRGICMGRAGLIITANDLKEQHEARWRRGGKCKECKGIFTRTLADADGTGRRVWLDCPTCHGTGWERWWLAELLPLVDLTPTTIAYGPQGRDFVHPVHYERGLITQVDANLADIFDGGRATPWALACVRGEPGLRRLWPVDRTPYDFDVDDGMRYGWHPADNYQVDEPDHIPRELFDMIFKRVKEWEEATYFDSLAAANRALAEAAWAVVKRQAGSGS